SGAARTVTVTRTVAAAAPAATGGVADVVAKVVPAVVKLRAHDYDGSTSEGSGVVIDRGGVILTNDHVVHGARTVTVTFGDGRHRRAVRGQVVGASASADLAVVSVPVRDLTALPLGRSKDLRLGDAVLAVGFPLDLGGGASVTQGIVSALHRTVKSDQGPRLKGLVQTDAAINHGNSGGALVDARGRLVGITTIGVDGSAQNVGFAIAIDAARPVIARLRGGTDAGAWLGAAFSTIASDADAAQVGLPTDVRGALAETVYADGPAAKAGLREGDVVVAAQGRRVRSAADLARLTKGLKPGRRVALDVVDQVGPRRVTVTVGRRPATLSKR
ncbi:MAG TPA: trypsin-like peptidase domain-containing protein, partial [Solirubrobacteraceae bacterium]|nr:trypsin-like peptidase domain-containing protein [Solirubrobacteraceae bacterium]